MFLLLAQRARQDGWWQDSVCEICGVKIRWTIDPVRSRSQLQTHLFERRVTAASRWQKDVFRNLHGGMFYMRGEGWSGDLLIANGEDFKNLSASGIHVKLLTIQAPGSRTSRKAVISMCRRKSQTLRSSSNPSQRHARQEKH